MNFSFTLPTPIPYINTTATQGFWYCIYLGGTVSNTYWQLQDVNGNNLPNLTGNWTIPPDVVAKWGIDDTIVTAALVAAAPWNITTPAPAPVAAPEAVPSL